MRRISYLLGSLALSCAVAAPSFAGMSQDLADCPHPDRPESAAACTRIMASGRLPQGQFYIAYFNRGWAYRQAGDNARARADFESVLKLNPRYASGFYSRAVVERDLGAADKAIADLEKALAIESGFTAAHTLLGQLLEDRGDIAGARTHYQHALASQPKFIDAQSAQAKARERLNALPREAGTSSQVLSAAEKSRVSAETSTASSLDCRRFIPSAGTTISVECTK
jgi:tetratricopeptide (TPR) repeat protein